MKTSTKANFGFIAILLVLCQLGYGQVSENFDGWSDGSYGTISTYTDGDGGQWETNNSITNSTNARSGNAVRFNDDSGADEYLLYSGLDGNGKDGGVGTVSLWYRHWDGDGSTVQFQVQYNQSGGGWNNIGGVVTVTSTTYMEFSQVANVTGDDILVRVISIADDERLMIDDLSITNASTLCTISDISISNAGTCNDNGTPADDTDDYYEADVTVTYSDDPGAGTLDLSGSGVVGGTTSAAIGTSPQTISGVRLAANGSDVSITATFSDDLGCTYSETVAGSSVASCSVFPTVGFTTTSSSVTEGDMGSSTHDVSITMDIAPSSDATVDVVSVEDSATEDDDYDAVSTSVTFTTGESYPATKMVSVIINGDEDVESDETFDLLLSLAAGSAGLASVGDDQHTVTISNDDMAPVLAFLNEIHYDNDGGDTGEFIEVAVSDDFMGALADLVVYLYNGNNGASYGTHSLSTFTAGVNAGGYTFYSKAISGIQNGAPDGFALADDGVLIEFFSYEGTFSATNGPASGTMSTDMGVSESGTEAAGLSLQRVGSCTTDCPSGLSWTGPISETPGNINTGQILPVELAYFGAIADGVFATIKWQTATEQNNSHFIIERSSDGRVFETIGRVEGAGDSDQAINYSFIDDKPLAGLNYYRLHQFDFDGTNEYFGPVAVRFGEAGDAPVRLWPVPTADLLQISLPETETSWQLEVFNLSGQLVLAELVEDKTAPASLDVRALPAGPYFLRWTNGRTSGQERFVKQ